MKMEIKNLKNGFVFLVTRVATGIILYFIVWEIANKTGILRLLLPFTTLIAITAIFIIYFTIGFVFLKVFEYTKTELNKK